MPNSLKRLFWPIKPSLARHGKPNACLSAVLALALALALSLPRGPVLAQDTNAYRLTVGDQISVRVLSWNAVTLQFETYAALAGDFAVQSNGDLVLPLLAPVPAEGRTAIGLAAVLGERYRDRLGLPDPPSVTLEVTQFGPIFVLGDVARPGRYDFAPGLTAIQGVALAGGVYRLADAQGDGLAGIIRAAGSLEEVSADLARQRMTLARLEAMLADAERFDRPDLPLPPGGIEVQDALFAQALDQFESNRVRRDRALASIDESRALLDTELAALRGKLDGVQRQLQLVRESVGTMESLLERGLARSPALVSLQRTQIELEARELDTETAIFRAQQRMSDLDREVSDLRTGLRLQTLDELQRAEAQVQRLEARRAMLHRLLAGAEPVARADSDVVQTELLYSILRREGDREVRLPADEGTRLAPRDVLIVANMPVEE